MDNQKLVSQIADLSRNLNLVNESLKRNTQGIQSLVENQKGQGSDMESAIESQDAGILSISKELKEISGVLSKMTSPDSPFTKMADAMEKSGGKTFDFNSKPEIKGKFQTGGVAKEDGKYLVGENGPEVVALPKGSGVIPINTKDLIEGLKKVPELSAILKDSDSINVTGDNYEKSILSSDGKRISLSKLITNYEDETINSRLDEDSISKETIEGLDRNLKTLEDLQKSVDDRLSAEFQSIKEEKTKLSEKRGRPESADEFKERLQKSEEILKTLPEVERSDIAIAKANLEAERMILLKNLGSKTPGSVNEETKSESVSVKTDLKKLNSESKKSVEEGAGTKEEKTPGMFSKIGGKLLKSAGRVAEDVAQKTGFGGALSLAKKGVEKLSEKKSTEGAETKMEKSVSKLSAAPAKPESSPEPSSSPTPPTPTPAKTPAPSTQSVSTTSTASPKTESKGGSTTSSSDGLTTKDLDEIKATLTRIAFLLEGPLTVSNLESPFRPDSRRV